ncbi:MAG: OstA-like protein, partial [Bacteroidota bacterium]
MNSNWYRLRRNFWSSLLVLMASFYAVSWARDKVKITYKADSLEGVEKGDESYKKLIDNVVFIHEGITIKADSAQYYDQKGMLEAYGHIEIIDQDGSAMVADRLLYDTNKKVVQLRDQVVYQSDTVTFYTDQLDYEANTKRGYFFNGGSLVEGDNTLSSDSGYYDDIDKSAIFYHRVELANKDYTLQCDTLRYNTITKIARFEGPTKITNKEGDTLTTKEGGEYNTRNKSSVFKRSKVETGAYILSGNLLRADQTKDYYVATGNVQLIAKEQQVTITGDHSQYWQEKGLAQVHGNPLLQRVIDEDTLYLTADTLLVIQDKQASDSIDDVVLAYSNVQIYKSDLQGKADSMAYHSIDSTIYFYNEPVFWNYNNQITADTIRMVLNGQEFDKMYMDYNAFIAAEDALGNYNQLKGRDMVAYFRDNKIDYIDIEGNGESLYFAVDDSLQLVGMNYLKCSHMHIDMDNEHLSKISFFMQPTGLFYPPHE